MQCAQLLHAAGVSSRLADDLPENTHAVALSASSEEELLKLEEKLSRAGIAFSAIREPDAPYLGALVAIGIAPVSKNLVRRFVSNLQLIR